MKRYQSIVLIVIVTIVGVLVAEVCVALAVMWWGAVNVGADHPHPRIVRWYLSYAMTYSVQEHARGLKAQPRTQVSIAEGASHYDHTCALCHRSPAAERSRIGQGLSPDAPHLTRTAKDWTVEQVYWLATHGVGDTGMPAFGSTYTDQQRWAIAYLVKQLPILTPAAYKELVAEGVPKEQEQH
jgi:mono/diheme cytochrome c family protein